MSGIAGMIGCIGAVVAVAVILVIAKVMTKSLQDSMNEKNSEAAKIREQAEMDRWVQEQIAKQKREKEKEHETE